jgi:hypothetical protein
MDYLENTQTAQSTNIAFSGQGKSPAGAGFSSIPETV